MDCDMVSDSESLRLLMAKTADLTVVAIADYHDAEHLPCLRERGVHAECLFSGIPAYMRLPMESKDEQEYLHLGELSQEWLQGTLISIRHMQGKIRRMLQVMYCLQYVSEIAHPSEFDCCAALSRAQTTASNADGNPLIADTSPDETPEAMITPRNDLERNLRDSLAMQTVSLHETWKFEKLSPLSPWIGRAAQAIYVALDTSRLQCNSTKHVDRPLRAMRHTIAHPYWTDPHPILRGCREYSPRDHWAICCHILPRAVDALARQAELLEALENDLVSGPYTKAPPSVPEPKPEPEPQAEPIRPASPTPFQGDRQSQWQQQVEELVEEASRPISRHIRAMFPFRGWCKDLFNVVWTPEQYTDLLSDYKSLDTCQKLVLPFLSASAHEHRFTRYLHKVSMLEHDDRPGSRIRKNWGSKVARVPILRQVLMPTPEYQAEAGSEEHPDNVDGEHRGNVDQENQTGADDEWRPQTPQASGETTR